MAYSTTEAALSPSKNLHDSSLPTGWRVQRIQSSIYFFSPLGERWDNLHFFVTINATSYPRFESREAVVGRLESEGASAEVVEKVQAGQRWEMMAWQFETILVEFRRRPGPRSVMISREELGYENMSEESGEESDPAAILKLPNGMRYRSTFFYNLMSWI